MPSFYCENCGKEVPPYGKECPWCGKQFYSVRCPVCNFTGPASLFTKGCPSCGYLGSQGSIGKPEEYLKKKKSKKKGLQIPRWVSMFLLIFLLISLFFLIRLYLLL